MSSAILKQRSWKSEIVKDALMRLKTPLMEGSDLLRRKKQLEKKFIGFELQSKFQKNNKINFN